MNKLDEFKWMRPMDLVTYQVECDYDNLQGQGWLLYVWLKNVNFEEERTKTAVDQVGQTA